LLVEEKWKQKKKREKGVRRKGGERCNERSTNIFLALLEKNKIKFIGPRAHSIIAMGDKICTFSFSFLIVVCCFLFVVFYFDFICWFVP